MNANSMEEQAVKRLRTLILQEDINRVSELENELSQLRDRIDDTDEWLDMLDPVIADSLARKINDSKEDMAEALAPVMGPAIKHQIEEAKDDMVDALYPVIGRTIRKSIAEAMKSLVQTVNERVDKALSFQLIFAKLKAKMTGVDKGALVLKDALPFKVREIFLIHKETGLLLAHVSNQSEEAGADQEIISSMLTAIKDFAGTAFARGQAQEINVIQYEDLQIYIEAGRSAYLAFVCQGVAPESFLPTAKRLEEKLHNVFHRDFREFSGDTTPFTRCKSPLTKFMEFYTPQSELAQKRKAARKPSAISYVVTTLIFIGLIGAGIYYIWGNPLHWFKLERQIRFSEAELAELQQKFQASFDFPIQQLQLVSSGNTIELSGIVDEEAQKIIAGRALAAMTEARIVLNNLKFGQALHPSSPPAAMTTIDKTTLTFDQFSANLTPADSLRLLTIVPLIKMVKWDTLRIFGHSDNRGEEAANKMMSARRARSVFNFPKKCGIDPDKMLLIAVGTGQPIGSNDTENGKAMNRRVELRFMRK